MAVCNVEQWMAIVNPGAGGFRSRRFTSLWLPRLSLRGARMVYTQAPGHAADIANAACKDEGIIVVGGDGTLLEVLAGIERDDHFRYGRASSRGVRRAHET